MYYVAVLVYFFPVLVRFTKNNLATLTGSPAVLEPAGSRTLSMQESVRTSVFAPELLGTVFMATTLLTGVFILMCLSSAYCFHQSTQ
jgi:hypothetical protein